MSITVLTAMSEPPRRFDVFTGTGCRRSFTAAEKAAIVEESYADEDSVCGVARWHGLSSSELFTWRRLAQPPRACEAGEPPLFVPVFVSPEPEVASHAATPPLPKPCKRRRWNEGASIEMEIDGVVMRVGRDADAGAIAAVIGALTHARVAGRSLTLKTARCSRRKRASRRLPDSYQFHHCHNRYQKPIW